MEGGVKDLYFQVRCLGIDPLFQDIIYICLLNGIIEPKEQIISPCEFFQGRAENLIGSGVGLNIFSNSPVMRSEQLSTIFPEDFIAIVSLGIVAGCNHNAGKGL